jgi:hypothetical protein
MNTIQEKERSGKGRVNKKKNYIIKINGKQRE